jgi:hypothetical protein
MRLGNISKTTFFLFLTSILTSFSGGIIPAIIMGVDNSNTFHVNMQNAVMIRALAEGIGYAGKCLSGYLSDLISNPRLFVLFGYGLVIVLKFVLWVFNFGLGSNTLRYYVFLSCNIMDRILNTWRDVPRDLMLQKNVDRQHLGANLLFRKSGSILGSISGLLFFCYAPISLTIKFVVSILTALAGFLIIATFTEHQIITQKQRNKQKDGLFSKFFKILSQRKWIFVLLIAGLFLFLGKVDDMLIGTFFPSENLRKALMIVFYLAGILFTLFLSLIGGEKTTLLLLFTGLLFVGINFVFIKIIGIGKKLVPWLAVMTVAAHGIHRNIIDAILVSNFLKYLGIKKDHPIAGTALCLLNIFICFGIGLRTRIGYGISSVRRIVLSCIFSIIGLIFLVSFAIIAHYTKKPTITRKINKQA